MVLHIFHFLLMNVIIAFRSKIVPALFLQYIGISPFQIVRTNCPSTRKAKCGKSYTQTCNKPARICKKSFDKFCKPTIVQILYRRNLEKARILAAEDVGFDLIKDALRKAVAGGAECAPHFDGFESLTVTNKNSRCPNGYLLFLAFLNLMYILGRALVTVRSEKPYSCNGFLQLDFSKSRCFCV